MLPSPTAEATRLTWLLNRTFSAREHARNARLDQIGVAALLPAARFDHVAASQNIAARITRDFGRQPAGFGVGANEHKQSPRLLATDFAITPKAIENVDRSQVAVAVDGCDLRAQHRPNVEFAADLVDQILRHALFERVGAHDQGYGSRMIGEEHRSLAGRISGADEMYVEPLSDARFASRRTVEYALAEQPVEAVRVQTTPANPGRDNDGARLQDLLVVEDDAPCVRIDADDLARDENLCA